MGYDYKPQTIKVEVPRSEGFTVRGLNLDDISSLVVINLEEIVQAAQYWQENKTKLLTSSGLTSGIIILSRNFPQLTSEILSIASDGWGTPAEMRQLPAGPQMEALGACLKMTVEDLGGLKNMLGLTVEVVRGAMGAAGIRSALGDSSATLFSAFADKSLHSEQPVT